MSSVFVTNKNAFLHEDRYDGEDYVFPPDERVMVPFDAAVHMLGYQLLDKSDTLLRLGWSMKVDPVSKRYVENTEGVEKLANFVFDEAVMVAKSSLAQALEKPRAA